MASCAHKAATTNATAGTPQPVGPASEESQRALTPSERLGPEPDLPGNRVIATLDQPIGPNFSTDGQRFTATVIPGSALPPGNKIVGRVIDVQPAMAGTMAFAVLSISGTDRQGSFEPLDARVAAVELSENQVGGREVNSTGAPSSEVIGSIIPQSKVPYSDAMNSDPLERGVVITLGSGSQSHHLAKGTRLVIQMTAAVGNNSSEVHKLTDLAVGRILKIDDVAVESVIGDVVFWVGPNKSNRTLVVLDPVLDYPEKRTVIIQGTHISLEGYVKAMPSAAEAPRLWKLVTAKEAADLKGHTYYIYATRTRRK